VAMLVHVLYPLACSDDTVCFTKQMYHVQLPMLPATTATALL
jgi:hypothetical protein